MDNIYVMNQQLEKIGIVDNVKSLIWAKRYIEFGDCEVYAPATPENLSLFQIDNYIMREDDDMVCRIDSVELDSSAEEGNYLIITGSDCKKILNQRIVWKQTSFTGQAGEFVRRLITQNIINPSDSARRISNFTLGNFSGFTDAINIQTSYDAVGDKIAEICRMFGYGSKVTFDGSNFVFNLYKGADRSYAQTVNPYVVFSRDFDNLKQSKFLTDKKEFGTVALVGGQGEGKDRVLTTVRTSTASGINRYEIFVDAKSTSNKITFEDLVEAYPDGVFTMGSSLGDDGQIETVVYWTVDDVNIAIVDSADEPKNAELLPTPYAALLVEAGNERLAELKVLTTFEGEVEANNTYVYGTDYLLGDIVQINTDLGIKRAARIVEVIESFSDDGYSLIPTFEYEKEA